MYTKSSTAPTTCVGHVDRPCSDHPCDVCPRPWNIPGSRLVDVDTCSANCVKMLCDSASATPDSSFCSSLYIPDAGGRTHPLQIGLWQQRARWSPSLPHAEMFSVLNAAARLIFHLRRSDHISDALICLHWLRVPERVEFKIAVLTHKVLCGIAPRYLGLLNRVITDISGRRSLRSSGTNRLVVPPFRLSTVGSRAFPVAAAKIWNALPDSLVSITSPSSFRHHLKIFLFQRSFS